MITSKLAYRQLKKNKKRTAITLLGIILSVSMITAIAGFTQSGRDMFMRNQLALGGDWHILFKDVSDEEVERLKTDPRIENVHTEKTDRGIDVKFKIVNIGKNYTKVMVSVFTDNQISDGTVKVINTRLLMALGILDDHNMKIIYTFGGILIAVVVAGSVLVIANAFSISANERIRQFGLLKSAGATSEQIRRVVLSEALILSAVAIPLGLTVGFMIEFAALGIANNLLRDALNIAQGFDGRLHVVFSLPAVGIAAIVSLFTIIMSAWFPARKVSKTSAIDAINLSREVKTKKFKTSRLVKALFGFEGTLADKSLKRSSGRYRATVISLAASIVLFIGGFSFSEYLTQAAGMAYYDHGVYANAMIYDVGFTENFIETAEKMRDISDMDTMLSYNVNHFSNDIGNIITDKMREWHIPTHVRIHSMPDETFLKLCRELSVTADFDGGILVNVTNARLNEKLAEVTPVNFKKDMSISLCENGELSLRLIAETRTIPKDIIISYGNMAINIIVPESMFSLYLTENSHVMAEVSLATPGAEAFLDTAEAIIKGMKSPSAGYSTTNIEKNAKLNKNANLLIMVFIMGFIGLLSLIAVTSVVGTISTNMALRRQEFAMLQSVGMTRQAFRRMLNYESLLYGFKALLYGLPLGIFVSWLFYKTLTGALTFDYIFPLRSVLICLAAVMLLTFATMRYSVKGLDTINIAESIRAEAI